MSSAIWTLEELSSNSRPVTSKAWRAVEAQHRVSTAKLTDTLTEQQRLEQIIEASKPNIPAECRHLSFLLSTPFRYGAPYPQGSRFRRPGLTPGVFYASELPKTAMTELAFGRLLFFAESPNTPWPKNPGEYTAFAVEFGTERGIDLTIPPLDRDSAVWRHPLNYDRCQLFAETARAAEIEAIKYESARTENHAVNFALLTCRTFLRSEEVDRQTWRIHLSSTGVRIFCEMPSVGFDFPPASFNYDPRVAAMNWVR